MKNKQWYKLLFCNITNVKESKISLLLLIDIHKESNAQFLSKSNHYVTLTSKSRKSTSEENERLHFVGVVEERRTISK